MARIKIVKKKSELNYLTYYNYYFNYFSNLYYNRIKINGLSDDANRFVLQQFMYTGQIAIFNNLGEAVATPFAPSKYNIYNEPVKCYLIALRQAPFIPTDEQEINKDCVIIYAQKTRTPLLDFFKVKCTELANVECAIKANVRAHKIPVALLSSIEEQDRMHNFESKIDDGETSLIMTVDDLNNFQAVNSGAPFIIDKLYKYKMDLIGEVLNFMGINSTPYEKTERLITDEVNSNNEKISLSYESLFNNLKEGLERANKFLGLKLSIKNNIETNKHIEEEKEEKVGDENDNT